MEVMIDDDGPPHGVVDHHCCIPTDTSSIATLLYRVITRNVHPLSHYCFAHVMGCWVNANDSP